MARGKGFSQGQVLRRHVLKNALCPYLTSVCMQFGHILGGSMLVEVVFSWKGMGTLIYDAVNTKDFPILQTCFLFIGIDVYKRQDQLLRGRKRHLSGPRGDGKEGFTPVL